MSKPVLYFIVPRDECFSTKPICRGKALYSPTAGLLALSAVTPVEQWDIVLTDENIEPVDFDRRCELVAISIMTVYARRGYAIADAFRSRGKKVVMGGVHATHLPYEALDHADAVVVGEAELVWGKVLLDTKEGCLDGIYHADRWFDMQGMKHPRRDLLQRERYVVTDFVQTSRGCPHNCTFCCERGVNGDRYRFRPISEVIQEIEALPSREIGIYDLDVFSKPARAYKLMEAMVPLRKRWQGGVSSRIAENDELLEMARKSGCYMLSIGFESISAESLEESNKGFNLPERYTALVKKIHSYGIMVFALNMFGFDSDDESVFEKTAKFWIEARADACAFSVLTPYPGTPLFHRLRAEGRITSYDWSKYDQGNVVLVPKQMSQETLRDGHRYAYETFYSWESILHRFPVLGSRDRFFWGLTNDFMRRFELRSALRTQVVRDGTTLSEERLAEHVRPNASGTLHPSPARSQ